MINRAGNTFGKLRVINDLGGAQLHCRCECGRESYYPRAIAKPSYRGPKACAWCLGSPCEECGTIIPRKARMPAATCSEPCRVARANRRERERYERIKDTNQFKASRAAYLERLTKVMDEYPDFAASVRDDHRRAVREWRARQMEDPALRARYLKAHREREALRKKHVKADPEAYERHLQRQRDWYHSLSDSEYQRIFVDDRKERDSRNPRK